MLLSPVLLFVILVVLLYLPPVQKWAVDKVTAMVSEQTGMQISVGHLQLSFPLDLDVDDVLIVHQPDTIASVENMVADVQLLPLLCQRVVINEIEIQNTRVNTNGFVEAAHVKGEFKRLFVASRGIDLDRQTIELNGAQLEDARLDISLNDSVPEDTTTTENLWKIHADSVTILRSHLALHMPGDTMSIQARMGSLVAREALIDLGQQTYRVASADWYDGALKYDQNYQPCVEGVDVNHIDLSAIQIGIDSIYYHDPSLHLRLRHASMLEKSGLQVSDITGMVAMEDGCIKLPDFRLKTPEGDVSLAMTLPLSITDSINAGSMALKMDAQLSRQDLLPFMASLPKAMQDRWPHYPLQVKGQLKGNLDYMEFEDLHVSQPTAFAVEASGYAAHINDMKHLQADVLFKVQTQNLGFVMAALPRSMQRQYRLPAMSATGRAKADGSLYTADMTLREGRGVVRLDGRLNADAMRYDAHLTVDSLHLQHFMPHESLRIVSAEVTAQGQGTDFFSPRTTLTAHGTVKRLEYDRWNLNQMTLQADVKNGRAIAYLDSHNQLLNGNVTLDALMSSQRLDGTLAADVNKLDLYHLGLVDHPLSIGLCGHVDMESDLKKTHTVSGFFNDLTLRDSTKVYRPTDIGLLLKTRLDTTLVRAQSGDFIVKLDASGDYEKVMEQCTALGDSILEKLDQKIIDQVGIRRLLPIMRLHVESKRDNPLITLLNTSQGIDFKELNLDIASSPAAGLNGSGYVHALKVSDMRLDTINFRLTQRQQHLSFGGQVRNNKKNPQFVFNALFDGVLQEHGATMGVRFYDAAEKLGARMGAKAEMVDSGISLHLVPERPTIGYQEFNLNSDNFIFFGQNKKVKANVNLITDDGTGVKIYSEDSDPSALQDITVSVNKLDLGRLSSVLPYYLPRMAGKLNGDFHVVQDAEGRISLASDMDVHQFAYENSRLGNLSTEIVYLQKEENAHAVELRLMKDYQEVGLFSGTYYNEGEGTMDARFLMERLPLSLVNGFIPDQLFGLHGYGEGELTVKGTLSEPKVDGEVYLDSSYIESSPYGVKLRFDNDPVRIINSQLLFENFTLYAYNNNPLNIQGYYDFSRLDHMKLDLRMRARDFQLIGAAENPQSIAFGKAFVNVFASMRGPVDNLTMRGRLEVLGSTDMSYVLRDSPLTTDNQLNELVKFTDFGDTATVVVERPVLNGFQMDMSVDVSKGAHVMAYLNTDHSNYIDLMGGGTLRMQYTPTDNLQLRGRYTLSNGEMKYSLPVIPLKTFVIQDGSYIEFTGDPMNPTLNITATERTKATVSGSDGAGRSVNFDCGVKITKTLNDMGLEFMLDAPEDMQLHNELQAMGVEQRGKLAVTMLTTGMYLADGNTKAFSMNSALSSFLSSEINNITGNALRTLDLSFGMDNSTDASGQSHTDYSFKFAKRFMNNRLKIAVGGLVSSGSSYQRRNNSFFDNVSIEYRLDQTANKFITLYYQNNSYDWLDGYTQKYGGGFTWRRSLQRFWDIFRFKDAPMTVPRPQTVPKPERTAIPADSLKTKADEKK